METYLQRTYGQKKQTGDQRSFPFWDYRSRRGSLSTSASCSDGSSVSSMSSSRSDAESESVSLSGSDSDSLLQNDPTKLTLQFYADPHEVFPLLDLYQPIVGWIDSDLQLFRITERCSTTQREVAFLEEVPSLAVIVFLHEEGMVGCERIQSARRHFEKSPWRFHHSEQLAKGKINPYPYNSQEFYYTSPDLPLWAVRQVHYGKEHIRLVVYTSDENWEDMLDFYKLILGAEPELLRHDFCLFTVHAQIHYNVQFALKRLPPKVLPKHLKSVTLQFKVTDIGHLVPLFPNICRPVQDNRWETTDHDGNSILLDVTGSSHNSSMDKSFSRLTLDTSLDRSHGHMSVCSSSSSGVYSTNSSNESGLKSILCKERLSGSRLESDLKCKLNRDNQNNGSRESDLKCKLNQDNQRINSRESNFKCEQGQEHPSIRSSDLQCKLTREQNHRLNDINDSLQNQTSHGNSERNTNDIRSKLNEILQRPKSRGPFSEYRTVQTDFRSGSDQSESRPVTHEHSEKPKVNRTELKGFYV